MQVWSQGQEDPLEKEMATRSSVLAWEIPWTEEPGGLQSTGSQRFRHDWAGRQQRRQYTGIENSKRQRRAQKNIWKTNQQIFSKFNETNKPSDPRSSMTLSTRTRQKLYQSTLSSNCSKPVIIIIKKQTSSTQSIEKRHVSPEEEEPGWMQSSY